MEYRYLDLLRYTYADRETEAVGDEEHFFFTVANPAWEGGQIVIARKGGAFSVHFSGLHRDLGRDFGAAVAFADRLIAGETLVYEFLLNGERVLLGTRAAARVDIDSTLSGVVRSLVGGDPYRLACVRAFRKKGALLCRVWDFTGRENRSFLLS